MHNLQRKNFLPTSSSSEKLPKGIQWPKGVIVRCKSNGWMDQDLMIAWIKSVWGKCPGALPEKSNLSGVSCVPKPKVWIHPAGDVLWVFVEPGNVVP